MKTKDQIRTGDAIEVEFVRRREAADNHYIPTAGEMLKDGPAPMTEWIPATAGLVDRNQIVAVFSDGERRAVPRHSRHWRPA